MLRLKLMDFAVATNVDALFFTTQAGVRAPSCPSLNLGLIGDRYPHQFAHDAIGPMEIASS
jgi:hypothetical protein